MSRIEKLPVELPSSVEVKIQGRNVAVKGPKGELGLDVDEQVELKQEDGRLHIAARRSSARPIAGTMRSLLDSMVTGVSDGFERRLQLVGVGYRAQMQGETLTANLGYSHSVEYQPPEGVSLETPSQTEIVVKGASKQQVGQVAAIIRGFRPPEPYKGKGIRYADERLRMKEAKKK